MQWLDRFAIERIGIPSLCLMENAGSKAAREIIKDIKRKKNAHACIFCGLGNNAGDGFVIARHLINAGVHAKVFLVGKSNGLKNDALINYRILKKCKYPVVEMAKIDKNIQKEIKKADILVDALFGTGLSRVIHDPFKSVIEFLNKAKKKIIAIDIPSGLDGTTGEIYGICIKAQKTITFAYAKKGFTQKHGPEVTGKVVVLDIGIPKKLIEKIRSGSCR